MNIFTILFLVNTAAFASDNPKASCTLANDKLDSFVVEGMIGFTGEKAEEVFFKSNPLESKAKHLETCKALISALNRGEKPDGTSSLPARMKYSYSYSTKTSCTASCWNRSPKCHESSPFHTGILKPDDGSCDRVTEPNVVYACFTNSNFEINPKHRSETRTPIAPARDAR